MLISNRCALSNVEKFILVLQSVEFSMPFDLILGMSSIYSFSVVREADISIERRIKSIELDDPYIGNLKTVLFWKDIKLVLWGQTKSAKHEDFICFSSEQGDQQQWFEENYSFPCPSFIPRIYNVVKRCVLGREKTWNFDRIDSQFQEPFSLELCYCIFEKQLQSWMQRHWCHV